MKHLFATLPPPQHQESFTRCRHRQLGEAGEHRRHRRPHHPCPCPCRHPFPCPRHPRRPHHPHHPCPCPYHRPCPFPRRWAWGPHRSEWATGRLRHPYPCPCRWGGGPRRSEWATGRRHPHRPCLCPCRRPCPYPRPHPRRRPGGRQPVGRRRPGGRGGQREDHASGRSRPIIIGWFWLANPSENSEESYLSTPFSLGEDLGWLGFTHYGVMAALERNSVLAVDGQSQTQDGREEERDEEELAGHFCESCVVR